MPHCQRAVPAHAATAGVSRLRDQAWSRPLCPFTHCAAWAGLRTTPSGSVRPQPQQAQACCSPYNVNPLAAVRAGTPAVRAASRIMSGAEPGWRALRRTLCPPMWEQRSTRTAASLRPSSRAAAARRAASGSPSAPQRASREPWQHLRRARAVCRLAAASCNRPSQSRDAGHCGSCCSTLHAKLSSEPLLSCHASGGCRRTTAYTLGQCSSIAHTTALRAHWQRRSHPCARLSERRPDASPRVRPPPCWQPGKAARHSCTHTRVHSCQHMGL